MRSTTKKYPLQKIFIPSMILVIIVQLVFIGYYQYNFYIMSPAFDSDAAAELLLAEHMAKSGEFLFSKTWFYSSEVRVIHNNLVYQLVFYFTNNYNVVACVGSVIIALLIALSVIYLVRSLGMKWQYALFAAILFLVPYGVGGRWSHYSLYYGAAYYSFFVINIFLFLGLWIRGSNATGKRRAIFIAVLSVYSLIIGLCGIRYAIILFVPLTFTMLLALLSSEKQQAIDSSAKNKAFRLFIRSLFFTICYSVGFVICYFVLSPYSSNIKHDRIHLTKTYPFTNYLMRWLSDTFRFTGFTFSGGSLFSFHSIVNLISLAFGLFVLYCAFKLLRSRIALDPNTKFYVIFSAVVFLFSSLSVVFTELYYERYTWLGMFPLILLPAIYLYMNNRYKYSRWLVILATAAILSVCNIQLVALHYPYVNNYADESAYTYYNDDYYMNHVDERAGYIAFLNHEGYTFGYSAFWDGAITTILTDGDVRMSNIQVDSENYAYFEWLEPRSYVGQEAQFLLLTQRTYQDRTKNEYTQYGAIVYQDDYFIIFDLAGITLPVDTAADD